MALPEGRAVPDPRRAPGPVAVIGGGRMGAGIAQVVAATGIDVVVVETDATAAAAAEARVVAGFATAVRRGTLDTSVADAAARRVTIVTGVTAIPADTAVVVEAVPEDATLKADVLAAAERAAPAAWLLATNTSALSVDRLAAALAAPHRFLGLHFFNPVPVSALVEVVAGAATDRAAVDGAVGWVAALGKEPVVVRDAPGFASSRLGVLLGLEAIRMLEEGVADAASIDRVMEIGYRHAMGPLRTTDVVGLDVRLAVADDLAARLGDRFAAPQLLRDKVARGELGRKTGRGFYDWPDPTEEGAAPRG